MPNQTSLLWLWAPNQTWDCQHPLAHQEHGSWHKSALLGSVLNNFGDAMTGTLKANEWWTLGTIYLPIALISLWGEGTPHMSTKEAACFLQVLKHTMCLVLVVIIVSKHYVSSLHSSDYYKQMSTYLSDLQTIHPSANFHPYHHLSLHLPCFFHLFGPSCCFWTYPFERLIGWIQRLLSNHKIGTLSWLCYTMWLIVFSRSNGVDSSGTCWTCYSQKSSASTLSQQYQNPPPGQVEARWCHLLDIQDSRRQQLDIFLSQWRQNTSPCCGIHSVYLL